MGLVDQKKNFPKSIHTMIILLKVCVLDGRDGVRGTPLILSGEKAVLFKWSKSDRR